MVIQVRSVNKEEDGTVNTTTDPVQPGRQNLKPLSSTPIIRNPRAYWIAKEFTNKGLPGIFVLFIVVYFGVLVSL